MDDLISRRAAIDALVAGEPYGIEYNINKIRELPSAQRKGKWIYLTGLDAFECSVCGSSMVRNIFNYCPWCGAEMKGEENDT